MNRYKDLTGQQFGRLEIIKDVGRSKHRQALWRCKCRCGEEVTVLGSSLRSRKTRSCGCLNNERIAKLNFNHGQARDGKMGLVYRVWIEMKQRCYNPNANRYYTHGARGITVCKRWAKSYENFAADMGLRPTGTQLERRNNNGDYTPKNCYWATRTQQARNKCNNRMVKYQGKTQCASAWCEELELPYHRTLYRLRKGWPLDQVFN